MDTVIIGATRGIGAERLDQAVLKKNHITMLARNPFAT
jgi:short-subunit dehydrogenase